ncbi:hypothetical protein L7F22_060453 [Adiantum nelumboides]|nr:hypothetical protein [Adiantum nelumboides]
MKASMAAKFWSLLRKQKNKGDGSCSNSSKEPVISTHHSLSEIKKSPITVMSSLRRLFTRCNCVDAAHVAPHPTNAATTIPHTDVATLDPATLAAPTPPSIYDNLLDHFGGLTRMEARAVYRLQFLTGSQWAIVMENCGVAMNESKSDSEASIADMVKMVMEWRRKRGDFLKQFEDEEEQQEHELEGKVGVPRLSDDMQEANMAILKLGFLKTDLQVECLLRGILYEGGDTKVQLISKLMDHKQALFLHSSNSFQVLAEQST